MKVVVVVVVVLMIVVASEVQEEKSFDEGRVTFTRQALPRCSLEICKKTFRTSKTPGEKYPLAREGQRTVDTSLPISGTVGR